MMEINGSTDNQEVFNFEDLGEPIQELITAAIEARTFSYCPYSKFAVGAALRTTTGEIIQGCNVENGSYGAAICAERTAFCKAISMGFKSFAAIAVIAYQEEAFTPPCGICRQFMVEFAHEDIPVYIAKPSPARVLVTSLFQLLPYRFKSEKLKK